jgi:calcineurin-like phosphoesterase family protein
MALNNRTTWFTSDLHAGHENIIKYDNESLERKLGYKPRPYRSADEMDVDLMCRWNETVGPDDDVYILGDMCMHKDIAKARDFVSSLNGNKFIVLGNHDKTDRQLVRKGKVDLLSFALGREYQLEREAENVGLMRLLPAEYQLLVPDPDGHSGNQLIVLSHYAHRVWDKSHHGSWLLYGHSHGSLPDDPRSLSFDCGCMLFDNRPITYSQVKTIMSKKHYTPIDHHK